MVERSVCTWCGQLFTGTRGDQLFCSKACKQRYWRWKHKLNLIRASVMAQLDEVTGYLDKANTHLEAVTVLGEISDRLTDLGFTSTSLGNGLPDETYEISEEL